MMALGTATCKALIHSLSASLSLTSHAAWVLPPLPKNLYISLSMLRKSSLSVNQLAGKQRL